MNDDPNVRRLIEQLTEFQRVLAPSLEAARNAFKTVSLPRIDFQRFEVPQILEGAFADIGRVSAELQAQASMFRELGPTLARALEVQQAFLRGLPSAEVFRDAHQRFLLDAETLAKAGWTFSMDMSPREISELAEHAGDANAIDEWFIKYYDAERGRQFRALAARLTKRKRLVAWHALLREALWAYRRKRYRLVVPALLATIEGLVCEVTGTVREKGVNAFVKWDRRSAKPPEGFLAHIQWTATAAFLGWLWAGSDFGGPQPDGLNRHWVLHGRHPQIGGRADALRLLAAVDFIADVADRIDRLNKKSQKKPKGEPPDGGA